MHAKMVEIIIYIVQSVIILVKLFAQNAQTDIKLN